MNKFRIFFVKSVTVLATSTLFGALDLVETQPEMAIGLSIVAWAWIIVFAWANDLIMI